MRLCHAIQLSLIDDDGDSAIKDHMDIPLCVGASGWTPLEKLNYCRVWNEGVSGGGWSTLKPGGDAAHLMGRCDGL
jgi:hypothetical protein